MEPIAVIFDRRRRRAFITTLEARVKAGPYAYPYWLAPANASKVGLVPHKITQDSDDEMEKRFVPLGRSEFAQHCNDRVLHHMWNKLVLSGWLSPKDVELVTMLQASVVCSNFAILFSPTVAVAVAVAVAVVVVDVGIGVPSPTPFQRVNVTQLIPNASFSVDSEPCCAAPAFRMSSSASSWPSSNSAKHTARCFKQRPTPKHGSLTAQCI